MDPEKETLTLAAIKRDFFLRVIAFESISLPSIASLRPLDISPHWHTDTDRSTIGWAGIVANPSITYRGPVIPQRQVTTIQSHLPPH